MPGPDVNRHYLVTRQLRLQMDAFLARRAGRAASWEILQDRPSLDGPPPTMYEVQVVTDDDEHAWAIQHGATYLGWFDVTTQTTNLAAELVPTYGTFQGYFDAHPELWKSRVP